MRANLYNLRKKSDLLFQDKPERRSKVLSYLLDAMIQEVHAIEATLLVVYIPTLERDTTPPPSQTMLQALEEKPVTLINLEPVIRQYYQDPNKPLLRLEEDGHPNVAASPCLDSEAYMPTLRL